MPACMALHFTGKTGFAPLLCDEVSVSPLDVYLQRGSSSCCLPPTARSLSTGKKVRTSNWHGMRAKQWDDITLHYSKCYFSFQLLPLCEPVASYWNSPSVCCEVTSRGNASLLIAVVYFWKKHKCNVRPKHHLRVHQIYYFFAFNISNNKHVLSLYGALSQSSLRVICFFCLFEYC